MFRNESIIVEITTLFTVGIVLDNQVSILLKAYQLVAACFYQLDLRAGTGQKESNTDITLNPPNNVKFAWR